jgi:hypothetical protein
MAQDNQIERIFACLANVYLGSILKNSQVHSSTFWAFSIVKSDVLVRPKMGD